MKKFKCEICNKNLHLSTYKARKMHINGSKHKIMKETYFMEILENEKFGGEIETHKKQMGMDYDAKFGKDNFGFKIPPFFFPKTFEIPPEPKNFKLPRYFVFSDVSNYKRDINETLQNIYKNKK